MIVEFPFSRVVTYRLWITRVAMLGEDLARLAQEIRNAEHLDSGTDAVKGLWRELDVINRKLKDVVEEWP